MLVKAGAGATLLHGVVVDSGQSRNDVPSQAVVACT
jgi:hypothetical protein